MNKKCLTCENSFSRNKTESKTVFTNRLFCSRKCYWNSLVGKKYAPFSEEHKLKIGLGNKGKKHSEKQNKEHSARLIGKTPWNKNKVGVYSKETIEKIKQKTKEAMRSPQIRAKISLSKVGKVGPHKGKHRFNMMGEKHPNWKGGSTMLSEKIRKSLEYKLWREAVFARDNWTCVWCGIKSKKGIKVELQADHIKPFAYYPELRFAIDNGRTLCGPCHKTTDTYGSKANNHKLLCQ